MVLPCISNFEVLLRGGRISPGGSRYPTRRYLRRDSRISRGNPIQGEGRGRVPPPSFTLVAAVGSSSTVVKDEPRLQAADLGREEDVAETAEF